jgi:ABC-type sugar transport system substrate-binding protein
VRHKFDVLDRHCERVGRNPAEITKTVFVFDTGDLAEFASGARALAAVGADGIIVVGPEDPGRIPAIGQVLADVFPG